MFEEKFFCFLPPSDATVSFSAFLATLWFALGFLLLTGKLCREYSQDLQHHKRRAGRLRHRLIQPQQSGIRVGCFGQRDCASQHTTKRYSKVQWDCWQKKSKCQQNVKEPLSNARVFCQANLTASCPRTKSGGESTLPKFPNWRRCFRRRTVMTLDLLSD